jgi:hypothetical protein
MKMRVWSVIFILAILVSCAPEKRIKNWMSDPSVQTGENRYVETRLEPIKIDKKFFAAFRLWVRNKTDKPLKIDWNRTLYIYNGRPNGGFAFKGIDPGTIKKGDIPSDTIAPRATFTKEIFPVNLVAFTPMREEVVNQKGRGLYPGPIPAGENGMDLVIRENGQEITVKSTLSIQAVPE